MTKQFGVGYAIIHDSASDNTEKQIKEREERAQEIRNQPVKRSHTGIGSGKGRAIAGQHFDIDKQEFIKAAAKDPLAVKVAQEALKGKGKFKKKEK